METQISAEHGLLTVQVDLRDGAPVILYDGWRLVLARGAYDDVPLLFVDTEGLREDGQGPRCRIHLNDEPIWQNPSYSYPEEKTNE